MKNTIKLPQTFLRIGTVPALWILVLVLCPWNLGFPQGVSITPTGNPPDASAGLDIDFTDKGLLIPRMTTAQRNAIASPALGLMIYNTDDDCFQYYNGISWLSICGYSSTGAYPDCLANTWRQKADGQNSGDDDAVGFAIGTKGYVGTGVNGASVRQKDFWEYDPGTDTWTQKADFGTATGRAVGFAIGTKGYIGTGENSGGNTKDFWEYDPGTNAWTPKTDFGGTARQHAVGFSIGTKGYIGTGDDGNQKTDFWEYNPVADTIGGSPWTQKADFLGIKRERAVGIVIGTKGYIGLGDSPAAQKDFWEYDPSTNVWTQKADFGGAARSDAAGFSIGTKGYIGTGDDSGSFVDFWEYDPSTDTWRQKANYGGGATDKGTGFAIGSDGYLSGGSKFWKYCPE